MTKYTIFMRSTLAVAVGLASSQGYAQALEEVMVTAQKRVESIQDVPISVDVLTADTLEVAKIDSAVDLALSTPSLNFQQNFSPFGSSFGMRGLNTFAMEGGIQPSVSFVVDNVPLARVGEFQAELGDIQRIEILRGPQGTLFGRNATAGAINLVRKEPSYQFESFVEASITDDEEYVTRAGVSGPLSENVRARLTGYSKQFDDYIENVYPGASDEGGERSWGLLGKLAIDLSDTATVLLTAEYRRQDTHMAPSVVLVSDDNPLWSRITAQGLGDPALGREVLSDPFKISQNSTTVADSDNWGLSADLSWDMSDSVVLRSITAYRAYNLESNIDVDASPANIADLMNMPVIGFQKSNYHPNSSSDPHITFDTDYFTQELRFEGEAAWGTWIVGGFYQRYNDESKNEVPLVFADYVFEPGLPDAARGFLDDGVVGNNYYFDANPLSADATWDSWAIFADGTWDLTDTVSIFAGLRWTMEDVELDYRRDNIRGPVDPAFFMALDSDTAFIDRSALLADPFWANFQQVTDFKREDRSEDWTGRIGINWDMTLNTQLYTSASRGFIGSGVNFGRNANYGNSIVEPSVAEAYEIGLKSDWLNNRLRVNMAVFWQEVTDMQTSRLVPGTVNTETFNAGVLESSGLEATITWAATTNLTLDLAATVLDTEMDDLIQPCHEDQTAAQGCINGAQDVSGNDGVQAPDLSYRVSARYDLPLPNLPFDAFAHASYNWKDDIQYNLTYDPLTVQESYGIADVVFGIEDRAGRYQITLFGKNVGDEEFFTGLSEGVGSIGRLYGRVPRQAQAYYGIKARYNFF